MSFRNAESHAYGEADLIVLRSPDGEKWTEAHRVNALPDDRDPQFLATEKRLFLYDPALQGPDLTIFAFASPKRRIMRDSIPDVLSFSRFSP